MTFSPSGQQFEISRGEQRATIVEVGGGIRSYRLGDRDVLHPYAADQMCDGAHGAPLIPWPNRLGDGRYDFDDAPYQVALNEPEKSNAIHGFLRWRPWTLAEHDDDRVALAAALYPLQGYPFALDVRIDYQLTDDGLVVRTAATNVGDRACPYGCGQHPYLSPGAGVVDDCTLHVGADTRITTDPDRQLPTGTEPVEGTAYDFRAGKRIGDLAVDFAFTDLHRDGRGRAWVRLDRPDGYTAEIWVDESYPIVEIYTADTLTPDRQRRGLGTEPMTCPPDAFRSGQGVVRLAPGETAVSTWGASLRATTTA